ncbi:putative natural resistance-associated macrophage protein [Lyophyllum shimeji]|uniref:Natural resistance-associated macrophage protein n=1 Tax=Lyophyllum shimeji TaxID=47721 RepID=A0A9P3USM4_LYOSH|nr:putative natural resistance-associated macrophage protein [Lyophyllum shimeji]
MVSVSPSSPWPAVFRTTLKLISLIVVPKPAFTFPNSNPTTAIPTYRTNQRNAMVHDPSTPINNTISPPFDQSQSMYSTNYGPMTSTPRRTDPGRSGYLRSSSQIEQQGCCCACHDLSASQGPAQGSIQTLDSRRSPQPRHNSIVSGNQSFPSPSPRPRHQTEAAMDDAGPVSTPTPSPISKALTLQTPHRHIQEHQRNKSSQLKRRSKLTKSKPRPRPRKSGRWGHSTSVAAAQGVIVAVRKSGNLNGGVLARLDESSSSPTPAGVVARSRSLRRSKRIVSSTVDVSQFGSVSGYQIHRTDESNHERDESVPTVTAQSSYQCSISPKKPQVPAHVQSQSFAGQSRYFELDLSPIIEDVRAFNPPALAPSPVIGGDSTPMHSSGREVSPRCSSFGDVLDFTPNQAEARGQEHSFDLAEESQVGDSRPLIYPRNLLIEFSKGSYGADASRAAGGNSSPKPADDDAMRIPDLILTSPTPDLSNGSPFFNVISTSGTSGLGLTLDYAVDEMGAVLRPPRGARDGDGRGEGNGEGEGQGYASPQAHAHTSRARTALFRTGGRSARRAWKAVSRFFATGQGPYRTAVSSLAVDESTVLVSSPQPDYAAAQSQDAARTSTRTFGERWKAIGMTIWHHARKHTGVGIVCAVAYFDPGNWGVDLQAGSQFGYHLLFVVLLAGLFAVFLQVLASRLGCVTGLDLASHCRLLLHSRPKHTLLYRWIGLYPLYVLAEVAIIATDLAELLGSAIALCMLFPKLQLWQGVLITAFDVFLLLAFGDPLRGRPVRMFEFLIAGLVIAVLVCMTIIIAKVNVDWARAFEGYLPSKYVFSSGAVYTSVGILGATVMPHSLFLGSALATQDRISPAPRQVKKFLDAESRSSTDTELSPPSEKKPSSRSLVHDLRELVCAPFRAPLASEYATRATCHADRENKPYEFVKAHIYHGIADVMISLLGFAVLINSFILILAGAVFFYGGSTQGKDVPASLFDAYDLIRELVGPGAATLFAVALLAAGQSSSIIATVAGQAVSEGFLQWRVSPAMRRIITRLIAMIPSMVVAIALGRSGIDTLLVASQVVLSIVLPFITFPLVYCTSSKTIMSVRKPRDVPLPVLSPSSDSSGLVESAEEYEMVDYSSGRMATAIGATICLVVVAANVYVIVSLARGNQV